MKKLIYILTSIFLLSCGTRKVETVKQQEEVKTEEQVVDKTKTVTETESNVIVVEDAETKVYTPVDPTVPMVITDETGKTETIYNGKKETKKTKTDTKANEVSKTEVANNIKSKVKTEAKKKKKAKAAERKGVGTSFWFWIGISAGLYLLIRFLIFLYRKYKQQKTV